MYFNSLSNMYTFLLILSYKHVLPEVTKTKRLIYDDPHKNYIYTSAFSMRASIYTVYSSYII